MKDAVIIQQAVGTKYKAILRASQDCNELYADKLDMDYQALYGEVQHDGWNPYWCKEFLITNELTRRRKFIFWLDADALVADWTVDLRLAVQDTPDKIGIVKHPTPPFHFSCGVMLIHNGEGVRKLFTELIARGPGEPPWYEQTIFNALSTEPEFNGVILPIDYKWNSAFDINPVPNPVIRAWHGEGIGDLDAKAIAVRAAAELAKRT